MPGGSDCIGSWPALLPGDQVAGGLVQKDLVERIEAVLREGARRSPPGSTIGMDLSGTWHPSKKINITVGKQRNRDEHYGSLPKNLQIMFDATNIIKPKEYND